jgi:hypothetical protein
MRRKKHALAVSIMNRWQHCEIEEGTIWILSEICLVNI